MSKINKLKRCVKCGTILQCKDPNGPGYVEKEFLSLDKAEMPILCNSCYAKNMSSFLVVEPTINEEFLHIIDDARATDALIIYVIDLFSFESSFIKELNDRISSLDVIVIANKRDLFPKNIKDDVLKEYVAHRLRVAKLKVKDVFLADSNHGYNFKDITSAIETARKRHDVYVIGAVGAGKSAFVYSFIKQYSNKTKRVISSSIYRGTSLRVTEIPLDASSSIYDLPGIARDNSILDKVEKLVGQTLIPTKTVKEETISLSKGQSIFIGGLARIDLKSGPKTDIRVYTSSFVKAEKSNVKNHDKVFFDKIKKEDLVPVSQKIKTINDFDIYDIGVDEEGERDLGIMGLGWLSFIGRNQIFRLYVPKGVSIYSTRAKIKHVK